MIPQSQVCKGCMTEKTLSEYSAAPSCKNGHRKVCKSCIAARSRAWLAINRDDQNRKKREKYAQTRAAIQSAQPMITPEEQARIDKQRMLHRKRVDYERGRKYRLAHPDHMRELQREWAEKNRERKRQYGRDRRALEVNARGCFTTSEWIALISQYGNRCLACGRHASDVQRLEPDHVVPLSRGGSNAIDNIQPLCRSCNARKHANTIDYRTVTNG